jgi:hypothetical protein
MKDLSARWAIVAILTFCSARAEPAYPELSWVAVRELRQPDRPKGKGRISGRVVLPPKAGRVETKLFVCQAGRVPLAEGAAISDTGCEEVKPGPDGRFAIEVGSLSEKESRWLTVSAPGYLPAGVLVESTGVEIDFLLVPEPPKASH